MVDGSAEGDPEFLQRRELQADHPAIPADECVGLRISRARARIHDNLVAGEAGEDIRHERHGRLDHVDVDAAAGAGRLPREQRAEDAVTGVEAGELVRDRRPAHHGILRIEEQAEHAAQRLTDHVEGRPLAVGTAPVEAGNRAIDQTWIDLSQRREAELAALHHAGAEVLDQHVGAFDQIEQGLASRRILDVDDDAALVAVVADEIRAVFPRAEGPERIAGRRLHLDDVRAKVREQQACIRRGDETAQFQNGDTVQDAISRTAQRAGPVAPPHV